MTEAAVVLAAGQGTRFRSDLAKVLHPVAGRTLLRWVLEAVRPLELDRVIVVVGHQAEQVRREAEVAGLSNLRTVVQADQRGTGHAVRQVYDEGALEGVDTVLVLPGDAPLLRADTLRALLDAHQGAATMLTTSLADPTGYGRILRDAGGAVAGVVEEADATPQQRAVREVGTSVYAFDRALLGEQVRHLPADNAQSEEYLTDVIAPLAEYGLAAVAAPAEDVAGCNDRSQLAAAGAVLRLRILEDLMRDGVTVVDPQTTYVQAGVAVAAEAVLLPGTHLEGATSVASGATVGPDCRLVDTTVETRATVTYSVCVGASIGPEAAVGPFSYLRPGTRLESRAKAGAFVEMKNSTVGQGSKVPHLSYIGDTSIGGDTNVGAATVTVNYDGFAKHRTRIGDRVHIGSDTMLVAPVVVGDDAYTGAGSVITQDVPAGALAIERSSQVNVVGYAERKRKRQQDRSSGRP